MANMPERETATSLKAPTKVQADGKRVTIPVEIRREFDISSGDYVIINVEPFDAGDFG